MPFLMLGEALVDLICEQAAEGIGEARSFTPHFGGVVAKLDRLREEGVDARWSRSTRAVRRRSPSRPSPWAGRRAMRSPVEPLA